MNPFAKYQAASASSPRVISQLLFVLDEIIKSLYLAKKSIENRDYETKFKTLSGLAEVFQLLQAGVDITQSGNLGQLLDNYYLAAITSIQRINMKDSTPAEIDQIVKSVNIIKDAINDSLNSTATA